MKCFYHSADLDGHASGAIIRHAYPQCELIGINYGQDFPFDEIKKGELVFMVDFSLQPFDGMLKLADSCDLVWIDHHKTAMNEAAQHGFNPDGLRRDGIGACALVWEHLHPSMAIPEAIHLLAEYDVWDHSDDKTLPFQYGFRFFEDTLPDNQALWKSFLETKTPGLVYDVCNTGDILLKNLQRENAKFCRAYAFETTFCIDQRTYSAVCANRGFTNSKLFDSVFDPSAHDLMITFCRRKLPAYQWTVSLYSTKDDVDCGQIAKEFGGGGHKGAAGFQCASLPFEH